LTPLELFQKKESTLKNLITHLKYAQLQPFRILFYIYLPSVIFPTIHMPWQSSNLIFNFLLALVLANVGYIAFLERDKLKQKGKAWFIHWLLLISIGIFTVEFIAFFAHTMIGFYEGNPPENAQFWNYIATVFAGLGGIVLEINYFFSEKVDRWIAKRVDYRKALLASAIFAIVIGILSLLMNPKPLISFIF